jgi:RNA-directed DNA polymerase
MSRLAALKKATSLTDLANLLAFRPKGVSFLLYKQPAATKYTTFQIPKRGGGHRTIKAPIGGLKLLQRRVSDLLQDCVDEINTAKKRKDRAANGFKRDRSILTNARQHRRRRWVFNVDLEDFFPSINFGRVRGFLLKNGDFKLHRDVATVIAQIACYENSLPQGSPCSPVISNLVAHLMDMRLIRLASHHGCTYSRYADDLTFSTNKQEFPSGIAATSPHDGTGPQLWVPGDALKNEIERMGFRINAKKTQMMYRWSRQGVTGLVVNEKINVRWEYRHNVRAMVNRLVKTGSFEVLGMVEKNGERKLEKRSGTLNELHGMLGFIDNIEFYNRNHTADSQPRRTSREKVYRKFLFYRLFFAAPIPIILCEGDTDNVYLTHAIRSLVAEFPDLAEKSDGKLRLKVRLYKYPESSTARLVGLKDGGSGPLSTFMTDYRKETDGFTAPLVGRPVLIVYDNDDGSKAIRNVIKSAFHVSCTGKEPFVRVHKNMYAVPTPLPAGAGSSQIEDCLDAATKGTLVGGKAFNYGKDFDPEKHFGKKVFAHKVVRPNASTIDFSGFRPLLTNIVAAINHYKSPTVA